jgi:membrane-associated protease RseP (regulator of RpoE activity)
MNDRHSKELDALLSEILEEMPDRTDAQSAKEAGEVVDNAVEELVRLRADSNAGELTDESEEEMLAALHRQVEDHVRSGAAGPRPARKLRLLTAVGLPAAIVAALVIVIQVYSNPESDSPPRSVGPVMDIEKTVDRFVLERGTVGLSFADMPAEDGTAISRVEITSVWQESPAEEAGMVVGDVVFRINGRHVSSARDARVRILAEPGMEITIDLVRSGAEHSFTVVGITEEEARLPRLSDKDMDELRSATMLAINGDFKGGVSALTALTNGPEPAAAHNNLGALYEASDDLDAAIRHYQAAVTLAPSVGLYRFCLTGALLVVGSHDQAVSLIETSVSATPDWAERIYQLSPIYGVIGGMGGDQGPQKYRS